MKKYVPKVIGGGAGVMRSSDEMQMVHGGGERDGRSGRIGEVQMLEVQEESASRELRDGRISRIGVEDSSTDADDRQMLSRNVPRSDEIIIEEESARDVFIQEPPPDPSTERDNSMQGKVMGNVYALGFMYVLVSYLGFLSIDHLLGNFNPDRPPHLYGWAIAGVFVMLAVPWSLQNIYWHSIHYVNTMQKYYIRIWWMVPIYSVQSFLALYVKEQMFYLDTAREAYESWVIFSYFMLLREYIHFRDPAAVWNGRESEACHHSFPIKYLVRPWMLGSEFMAKTHYGVFQYVVLRTSFAVLAFIAETCHMYGEGEFGNPFKLFMYQMVVVNLSQSWALYCLLLFYHETAVGLKPLNPFSKFMSIKGIIFLSFWQHVVITWLASNGYIKESLDHSKEDVQKGLEDFLVCIEMVVAAAMFHRAFPWQDFLHDGPLLQSITSEGSTPHKGKGIRHALVEMFPTDVVAEVHQGYKDAHKQFDNAKPMLPAFLHERVMGLGEGTASASASSFVLTVKAQRAVNLKGMDRSGKSDPYLQVYVTNTMKLSTFGSCPQHKKCKTKVQMQTLNPEWNETFEIPLRSEDVEDPDQVVIVQVWDWDRFGSNDLIGEVQIIHLSTITRLDVQGSGPEEKWYQVFGLTPSKKHKEGHKGGGHPSGANELAGVSKSCMSQREETGELLLGLTIAPSYMSSSRAWT